MPRSSFPEQSRFEEMSHRHKSSGGATGHFSFGNSLTVKGKPKRNNTSLFLVIIHLTLNIRWYIDRRR
jgi:hypothetical protein